MASYNTNLKTWGASGSIYPDGYNYSDGEQPVDEWDNFVNSNLISDVKDHLIPLTNSRVESDVGPAGGEPANPETSHVYHDQDGERLELWDTDKAGWRDIMFRDGDTMTGALDMGNYPVEGHTDLVDNNGNVIWDYSSGYIPQDRLQNESLTIANNTVSLGSSISISLEDLSDVTASGEGSGNGFDADTVDGKDATEFASSGHTHDGRYYTESQADSRFINDGDVVPHPSYATTGDVPALSKGEVVFIDGDGLYVEDGN